MNEKERADLRRAARTPLWIGAGVIVLLVALFSIWGAREHHRQREEARRAEANIAATEAESRRIRDEVRAFEAKLAAKKAAALRSPLPQPAVLVSKRATTKKKRSPKIKRPSRPSRSDLPLLDIDRCKGSPDPLCNLPRRERRHR